MGVRPEAINFAVGIVEVSRLKAVEKLSSSAAWEALRITFWRLVDGGRESVSVGWSTGVQAWSISCLMLPCLNMLIRALRVEWGEEYSCCEKRGQEDWFQR